jgi:hypothetical protein
MDFGHFHRTLDSCLHPDLQQFFLLKYNQLATVGGIFLTATPDLFTRSKRLQTVGAEATSTNGTVSGSQT